ncbi:type I restriction endonuclease subunit R [Listeria welshimeri]|uniref:type I restriction endonuclease subunit R n=1 Tax=Listeria welshimeri TaxID=1643 RepID=UPI001887E4D2|nr:type I restriction endonuclease subunit R [Listeria welshimeri]MBF2468042.1 type I restriction endonuclease subunit R [Listeria welshimeri]MBF2593632.1 type I restriction endonuclease subunit R [Listeria welshimeri]
MRKVITEDMIEQACIQVLSKNEYYNFINANINANKVFSSLNVLESENDGTGRSNIQEVILPKVFFESLQNLNPHIPTRVLEEIVQDFRRPFTDKELEVVNYDRYRQLKCGIHVKFEKDGKKQYETVRIIDFNDASNNMFTIVSQMWIKGETQHRRPDLLLFVNGLPIVFIELKNSDVNLKTAYDKNLQDYIRDIPQLFHFNQLCVLSNASETRIGSFTANYSHFFEWLRSTEDEEINRQQIRTQGISIQYLLDNLLKHETLLDYVENFILFENKRMKILAKNHQFLGVNNGIESFKNREKLNGKLGVFWHTQGSGKSYSMAMFINKINRKITGNFTFLMVTDRQDLDDQLYKNFLRTETVTEEESANPKNGTALRKDLQTNKPFLFTLIQKFRYDKGKKYPVLSERDDIVVIVDEAHRTQYKSLAENMRTALPNAQYIAFTGTPLLGSKRLTNQWFGDYVSEYNFAQSIEDGSTVPLYYSRRVPEVWLTNDFLEDDYLEIIEDENLTLEEEERLSNYYSKTNEVLKRDDRLNIVARDIVEHFPNRGYLGKAMVISVDKFTTVRMYDKVKYYWNEKLKDLYQKRSNTPSKEERDQLNRQIKYMQRVEMAVVVSEDGDEDERFKNEGLDFKQHRERMNLIDGNGHDIEDNFKDPNNPLSIVFVCAMWLTGFDAPSTSTIYLDKPMKSHTLMQTIARINRVFPGKNSGLIVDYLNLFKHMKQALGDYANPDSDDNMPVKNIDEQIRLLDSVISETKAFCEQLNINFDSILERYETFDQIEIFQQYTNILLDKDENLEEFKIYVNLCRNIFEACKPEIFEFEWKNKYLSIIFYLGDMIKASVREDNIESAKIALGRTLDLSVQSSYVKEDVGENKYEVRAMKTLKLSEINTDDIRKTINESPYKNIEIHELRLFIEDKLEKLLEDNKTRTNFVERYKELINRYNSGNSTNEDYYEDLVDFVDNLKQENERHVKEGLTEEELEIYDLLKKDRLTKKEEEKVKLSAKRLYESIKNEQSKTNVIDWYKDEQPRQAVKFEIEKLLDETLPDSYDKDVFKLKTEVIMTHLMEEAMMERAVS